MNRQYLISTVRSYRDKLLELKLKQAAECAEDLLDELLDAGREWHRMVGRVHALVDLSERSIRRYFDEE